MISACMAVSVRELRTAVREWACCRPCKYRIKQVVLIYGHVQHDLSNLEVCSR